MKNSTILLDI